MNDQPTHPSKDVKQTASHLTSQNEMVSTDPQAQGGGYDGLDADIDKMLMWNIQGHTEPVVFQPEMKAAIKKLIATRLRAQLDEVLAEGPKDIEFSNSDGDYRGNYESYNESNSQWRTLLAKKRDTL